jgi:hypothetical protein
MGWGCGRLIARMNARLMWGRDVISDFRLEQSFHSFCSQSFHSSCGGAGNFFLCSCKEKSQADSKLKCITGLGEGLWGSAIRS